MLFYFLEIKTELWLNARRKDCHKLVDLQTLEAGPRGRSSFVSEISEIPDNRAAIISAYLNVRSVKTPDPGVVHLDHTFPAQCVFFDNLEDSFDIFFFKSQYNYELLRHHGRSVCFSSV